MTTKGTDNRFRSLTVVGESGTPSTPASGDFKLYVADDGTFYLMDDTGATVDLTAGGFSDPMTTRGDIIVRNASNVTARLAKGSADTFLHSDGTDVGYAAVTDAMLSTSDITTNNASTSKHGFVPKYPNDATKYLDGTGAYSTPAGSGGGSFEWLANLDASSSSTLDYQGISSTFDVYDFIIQKIVVSGNNHLWMRVGTTGSFTIDTGSKYNDDQLVWRAGGSGGGGATGQTKWRLTFTGSTPLASSTFTWNGHVRLYTPNDTSSYKHMEGRLVYSDTGFRVNNEFRGDYDSATAVTAVQFLMSSGTITSGRISVYGLKHA